MTPRTDPLEQWLSQLGLPRGLKWPSPADLAAGFEFPQSLRGLELAARGALESGRLEAGRVSDQLLAAFFRASAPAWPLAGEEHVERVRREVEARIESLDDAGALDAPERFHPEAPPAVARIDRRTLGVPGFTPEGVEEWSFWSEWEGAHDVPGGERWGRHGENQRARGWMLAHRELDRPWLLCLHGYGMGWPTIDPAIFRAATHHHELGINVAGLILPLHGSRAGRSRGARELIQSSPVDMLHAQGQAVWDARRLIGWLRGLGVRDIGVHGFSLGGVAASLLAALDAELSCVIAGAPAYDITESYRSAAADRPGTPVPDKEDPIWERVRTLFSVISPLSLPPVLERGRLSLYGRTRRPARLARERRRSPDPLAQSQDLLVQRRTHRLHRRSRRTGLRRRTDPGRPARLRSVHPAHRRNPRCVRMGGRRSRPCSISHPTRFSRRRAA